MNKIGLPEHKRLNASRVELSLDTADHFAQYILLKQLN